MTLVKSRAAGKRRDVDATRTLFLAWEHPQYFMAPKLNTCSSTRFSRRVYMYKQ